MTRHLHFILFVVGLGLVAGGAWVQFGVGAAAGVVGAVLILVAVWPDEKR